jgi:carboxyl-terminal processing protease
MQFYAATPGDIATSVPIVMLVDGRSASAAEILAAALQDNGRAIAVGTATVGKGTVQTIIPLANGGEFALTWSRVITPAGTLLAGRGILPDVCTGGTTAAAPELIAALLKAGPRPRPPAEVVRAVCRPEPHDGDNTLDVDVAHQLVADASLRAALRLPDASQLATTH